MVPPTLFLDKSRPVVLWSCETAE